MRYRLFAIISVMLVAIVTVANAKVILSPLFTDNMVLQRETDVIIWGKATPGKIVKISASWTRIQYSATVCGDSLWTTKISTPGAGGPYTISFKEGETTTISNILIGDVFFCSGQSNMSMTMKGYESQPIDFSADRIINAKPSKNIRMCDVPKIASTYPLEKTDCKWDEHTRTAVANISAVAYFFAETMQNALDVPIGIIVASWGGTTIESWMTKESLEKCCPGEFNFDHLSKDNDIKKHTGKVETMYDGQVAPLIPFTVKGFVWYQGESNRNRHNQYVKLQTEYARMMREKFQSPDAGFYFVQIAPFSYDNSNSWESGYFCEAQAATLKTIPHSAMATTLDVGDYHYIHPSQKLQVGQRLAYLALSKDYGFTEIEAESPTYKSMTIEGDKIKIELENCSQGISPLIENIPGFEIAGEDKVFHKADANRDRNNNHVVIVSSNEVPNPVAVRFCFRNFQTSNLFNNYGIPVGPFRTDNWDL